MKIISRAEARNQGLDFYFTNKPCKWGHIEPRRTSNGACAECVRKREKQWRSKNKDKVRESYRRWAAGNRESIRERERQRYNADPSKKRVSNRLYHHKNRERMNVISSEWYRNNKEEHHARSREYRKLRRAADPEFRLSERIRYMLWRTVQQTGGSKSCSTFKLLGYTRAEVKKHIERQFTKGMSWENWGEWHIDHIIPIAEHIKNGETDPAVINCLTNLRPMWAKENIRKSDSRTHLL